MVNDCRANANGARLVLLVVIGKWCSLDSIRLYLEVLHNDNRFVVGGVAHDGRKCGVDWISLTERGEVTCDVVE